MILLSDEFDPKEEVPTTRFWLMTKLKLGWDKKWEIYIDGLRKRLIENMTSPGLNTSEAVKAKKLMADKIIEKVERSAWASMPAEFLKAMNIPRVIRH